MAKMDVYGPGQQKLLHLHGLVKADTHRRMILRDLAVPRASRSSINIGGPKTDRQRRDLRDRPKRLEPVKEMTRVNRDLTLQIHGLLKVAQPFVIAGFRQENERVLLALKRYVEKGNQQKCS